MIGESTKNGGTDLSYRELVLYEKGQAYPEYIITFKRSLEEHKVDVTKEQIQEFLTSR